ncbi:MAG: M15 family metallopeptidase [Myxococcota bacterium]
MEANNTSAFNCRRMTSGSRWSEHAYGTAIDVNPIQNPYVRGAVVQPPAGEAYVDRTATRKGMLRAGGPVVGAFAEAGWKWGGEWRTMKDYQHFSVSGR